LLDKAAAGSSNGAFLGEANMKLRTFLACVTLTALAFGTADAQQRPTLPAGALQTAGELHVAADFAAAPNQFIDAQGRQDGLNVDMCGEIAGRLGLRVRWTNLAFPGLVPGLQATRYDALCTAIFVNPQRLEIMNMVSYVQWGEGMMMRRNDANLVRCEPTSGNAASYNACFDQLSGRAVSVASAGTTHQNLRAHSERLRAAGRPEITIRAFDTNADTIQALVAGQVQAAYLNDPQGAFFISREPANRDAYVMAFVGNNPNRLAIATLRNNRPLADAIKWALEQMRADGSYERIVRKWGVAMTPEFTVQP
jgi:polar amino acid transport system substrate-binding protein